MCAYEDTIKMSHNSWDVLDVAGPGHCPVAGCFEHNNEPSGHIEGMGYPDQLSDC